MCTCCCFFFFGGGVCVWGGYKGLNVNKSTLVLVIAWHQIGNKAGTWTHDGEKLWCYMMSLGHYELMLETQMDGLVQDCNISIANALDIMQSCTKPWRYSCQTRLISRLLMLSWGHQYALCVLCHFTMCMSILRMDVNNTHVFMFRNGIESKYIFKFLSHHINSLV